jgi:hypothetical protein
VLRPDLCRISPSSSSSSSPHTSLCSRPLEATLRIFLRTNTVTSTAIVYYLQREGVSVTRTRCWIVLRPDLCRISPSSSSSSSPHTSLCSLIDAADLLKNQHCDQHGYSILSAKRGSVSDVQGKRVASRGRRRMPDSVLDCASAGLV